MAGRAAHGPGLWHRLRRPVAASWVLLVAGIVVAALPLFPPAAHDDAGGFSVTAALAHVDRIAAEPRPIGSAASARARGYLVDEITALGLEPELQELQVPDYYGAPGEVATVVNVLARIPGTASSGAVAVMAHYDTVPATRGANDNAAGVAVVLETARAILADTQLRNDVLLLLTDGEEPAPRLGSSAFVSAHPWAADVAFVVNLEAAGGGGPSLLVDVAGPNRWAIDRYDAAAPYPAAVSFLTATTELCL